MPPGIYPRRPPAERFWSKVDKNGPTQPHMSTPCWVWTGGKDTYGYGCFKVGGGLQVGAHVFAYEAQLGAVAPGLELDHLCRHRSCVNPVHLEPVAGKVNNLRGESPAARNARKTHCPKGHPYTGERNVNGDRVCKLCRRESDRRRYHKPKAVPTAAQEGSAK